MLFFFILLGALSGGILGGILRRISSPGIVHDIFLKGYDIGLSPATTINLYLITVTFGFTLQINLLTLLGIILGVYTYKQA